MPTIIFGLWHVRCALADNFFLNRWHVCLLSIYGDVLCFLSLDNIDWCTEKEGRRGGERERENERTNERFILFTRVIDKYTIILFYI